MRVGSLVYATNSGLGILAKAFYDNGIVTDPYIVRHGHHVTHEDWYPNAPQISSLRDGKQQAEVKRWAQTLDVFLALETPFLWELIEHCREHRVKTVIMPMHECMPASIPFQPDLWLCPSALDLQWSFKQAMGYQCTYLPVPVQVPWRQRTEAKVFVHNSGHGGLKGRNGTAELCEAIQYVRSDAKFIIRSQSRIPPMASYRVQVVGDVPYDQLFAGGDVFLFPEKFNGLSLPLQEARASGMLIMAGDRFPINTWLPREPLIPVKEYRKNRIGPPYAEFDEAVYCPRAIAATIDAWYGTDITDYSEQGREWAEANSWAVLKPKYIEALR